MDTLSNLKTCVEKNFDEGGAKKVLESFHIEPFVEIESVFGGTIDDLASNAFKKPKKDVFEWDDKNTNRLIELSRANAAVNEMIDIFDTSSDTIKSKLSELGMPVRENFENTPDSFKRMRQYFNTGIFVKTDPNLNIVDTLLERKFIVPVHSVSFFDPPEDLLWTPIEVLESSRDNDGNEMPIDPIEYEIRDLKLTPAKAIEKVVKERIEPFVNTTFTFSEKTLSKEDLTYWMMRLVLYELVLTQMVLGL